MYFFVLLFVEWVSLQYQSFGNIFSRFRFWYNIEHIIIKPNRFDVSIHFNHIDGFKTKRVQEIKHIFNRNYDKVSIIAIACKANISNIISIVLSEIIITKFIELYKFSKQDYYIWSIRIYWDIYWLLKKSFWK